MFNVVVRQVARKRTRRSGAGGHIPLKHVEVPAKFLETETAKDLKYFMCACA
jgi:hypothetical protein